MISSDKIIYNWECGIVEINRPYRPDETEQEIPFFNTVYQNGVHFLIRANDEKLALKKLENLIAAATGDEITTHMERYIDCRSEFFFSTDRYTVNVHIEKVHVK